MLGEPPLLTNGFEELSTAKLTDWLRAAGVLGEGSVVSVGSERIGIGFGATCDLYRLSLEYAGDHPDAPPTLIAKLPARAPESNQVDPSDLALFATEVGFYRHLAPHLECVPRALASWVDLEAGWAGLLLEDLGEWQPGDALLGCTPDEAAAIVDAIAMVHAADWERSSEFLAQLPRWAANAEVRSERTRAFAVATEERFGAALDPALRTLLPELAQLIGPLAQQLEQGGATLIHGDLHLDNVFLRLPEAKVLDWQNCRIGPPALDLGMLIFGSLPTPERRAGERDLLERYRQQLRRHGVVPPTLAALFDDYLRALVPLAVGMLGWLARTADDEFVGRERELVDAVLDPGWIFAACVDHAPRLRELANQPRPDASR